MNIVVCVKQVPDTETTRKLKSDDKTLDRAAADGVLNELDEYAVEEALRIKEAHGGEVTVLTMGPGKATDTIRKALSMGADKAVHLTDDALAGSDALQTSYAIQQVLGRTGFDLVILGSESTDARTGVLAAMLAERLGVPQLSLASKVEIDGSGIKKGIMAAKKKPFETLGIADAGIDAAQVGLANATTEMVDFAEAPPREQGQIVKDEGEGGMAAAEFLASKKFI